MNCRVLRSFLILFVLSYGLNSVISCGGGGNSTDSLSPNTIPESEDYVWYLDHDGDGYGNNAISIKAASQPDEHVLDDTDCNDDDASIHPFAAEICDDGIDQDCNEMDSVCSITWYLDNDGDGYGDPDIYYESETQPSSDYVLNDSDCNDSDPDINPDAEDIPNDGIDNNCDGVKIVTDEEIFQCTGQYNGTIGAYIQFNDDYSCSMHNGEYHAYGTYTQNGNSVTINFNGNQKSGVFALDCSYMVMGGWTYPKEH